MEFVKICGFAVSCGALVLIIANREKELTAAISSVIYIIVMLYAVTRIDELISSIKVIVTASSEIPYINYIISIIGIAIIGAVASALCENTGQKTVAHAIDVITVTEIFIIVLPIFKDILEKAVKIFGDQYI